MAPAHGEIVLRWQPEKADYADAFAVRNGWRAHVVIGGGLLLSALAAVIGLAASSPDLAAYGVAIGVTLGTIWLLRPVFVTIFWRRVPMLHQPTVVTVTPVGLDSQLPDSQGHYDWAAFRDCLETSRSFVLQLTGRGRTPFMVLAKRGLAQAQDEDRLRELLRRQLPGGVRG